MTTLGNLGVRLDLDIRQGADFGPFTITVSNPDGSLADLTSVTAYASLRQNKAGAGAVDFEVAVDDGASTITLALADTVTAALPVAAYTWDLDIVWADGKIDTPLWGDARVVADVTRF